MARQKVPGRGPAPLGLPLRDTAGQTQMIITDDRDIIVRSERNFSQQTKENTNLPKTWREIPVLQKDTQNNNVTRSSWLNCALGDDEAVYWVSIGHYEAVAVGN